MSRSVQLSRFQTQRRRPRLLMPRVLFGALGAVLALTGATTPPASATVTSTGGAGSSSVACNWGMAEMRVTSRVTPQTGYTSQYIATRVLVRRVSDTDWTYGPWRTQLAPHYGVDVYPYNPSAALNLRVLVQYEWYTSRGWSAPVGEYITSYRQVYGASVYQSNDCLV